jgi:hypothetical protein
VKAAGAQHGYTPVPLALPLRWKALKSTSPPKTMLPVCQLKPACTPPVKALGLMLWAPAALTTGTLLSAKYPMGLKTVVVVGSNLPQAPPTLAPT